MTLYGFYSAKAAKASRSFIYTTTNGGEVEVTRTSFSEKPFYNWPDTVPVGPVVNFVREVNA
jgi:hypothetical protein